MGPVFPKHSLNSLLASTVKNLRLKKNLSQEDLASLAMVDRTYISGIERARRNITIATLERLIPHLSPCPADFFKALCDIIDEQKASEPPHQDTVIALKS